MTLVFILFLVGVFIVFAIPGYLLGLVIFAPFRPAAGEKPPARRYIRRIRSYRGAVQVEEIEL